MSDAATHSPSRFDRAATRCKYEKRLIALSKGVAGRFCLQSTIRVIWSAKP